MTCARCGCGVYEAEDRITLNKIWHKCCFSCRNCDRKLDKCTAKIFQGEIYCECCYECIFEDLEMFSSPPCRPCRVVSSPSCICIKKGGGAQNKIGSFDYCKKYDICFRPEEKVKCTKTIQSCSCLTDIKKKTKPYCFAFPIPREVANYYNRASMRKPANLYTSPPNCCPQEDPCCISRETECRPRIKVRTIPPQKKTCPPTRCRSPTPEQQKCCCNRCRQQSSCPPPCPPPPCPCICPNKPSYVCRPCPPKPGCGSPPKSSPPNCCPREEPSCPSRETECRPCTRSPRRKTCPPTRCRSPSPEPQTCCCNRCRQSPNPTSCPPPCPCACPNKPSNDCGPPKPRCGSSPKRRSSPTRRKPCVSRYPCQYSSKQYQECPSAKPRHSCCPPRDGPVQRQCTCCCEKVAKYCVCGRLNPCNCNISQIRAICTSICVRCGHKVYAAEKVSVSSGAYHTSCFSCYCCHKLLDVKNVYENCGEIYCRNCYNNFFGLSYYGYGPSQYP